VERQERRAAQRTAEHPPPVGLLPGVAVDGKALRGARTAAGRVFLVGAIAHVSGVVLGQRQVPDKRGEGTVVHELLAPLDVAGMVLTLDALCRHRHKASYADPAVMPRSREDAAAGGVASLTVRHNHDVVLCCLFASRAEGKNMGDPSRVRMSGPLTAYAEGFAVELAGQGYAVSSVVFHLRLMAYVSRWLEALDLGVAGLTAARAEAVLAERREAGYAEGLRGGSLEPLLRYLRGMGAIAIPQRPEAMTPVDVVAARYADYVARERGLAGTTIERNIELVRPFLTSRVSDGRLRLEELTAGEVIAFVVAQSRQRPSSVPRMVTALRSLLRFLHVDGVIATGLADAVPTVAERKLAGLPRALTGEQVAAMLATCDRDTAVGRRDLAILTVLSRLGLRAGEVAALRLDDIDWRRGELTVSGKGNRQERLPLPADVGSVIVSYLRDGRPSTGHREVFICVRAPHRGMTRGAVTNVAAGSARKAGLGTVHAHRLRHSAATAMLSAGGSLGEIGQVLRHRNALTTAIYAKVDTVALRTVARSWPGSEAAA
jgi:site-specific recombinase XerD